MKTKTLNIKYLFLVLLLLLIALLSLFHFRIDLTSDKRYSISDQTKHLLRVNNQPLKVNLYLTGELNPGFTRLKKSTIDLLDEIKIYYGGSIDVNLINPSEAETDDQRNENYKALINKGMKPTAVYERDKEGKSIQKVVFPWLELRNGNRTVYVNLLKNVGGKSGEENLNISIENLEYELMDGIRQALNTTVTKIAFLEGNGELNEAQTYDISKSLSRYFQIDRGVIGDDAAVLSDYKLLIVAKPRTAFTETQKLILDQYIMNGGKVIWLIDGIQTAVDNLSLTGITPAMALDLNLGDMFFKYGVRIQPVILQDVQCLTVPVNIAPVGANPQFEPAPLLYAPLLLTSQQHPITKNITEVKTEFCSGIEILKNITDRNVDILLATSNNTHVIATPVNVDLGEIHDPTDKTYFNTGYVPVGVLVTGSFPSVFTNRMLPKVSNLNGFKDFSLKTSQLFVADGDIIRNETTGIASDSTTMELGLDRYSGVLYGNKDFLVNAVLYMTDDGGWMQLKSKSIKLRMLNKQLVTENNNLLILINIIIPFIVLILGGMVFNTIRKKRYQTKKF